MTDRRPPARPPPRGPMERMPPGRSPGSAAPPRRRQTGRQSRGGRGWLVGLGIAVALLATVATYLAYSFPSDVVRDRIVAEVKARTGRDLTISGPATFAAIPYARVTLNGIVLSPPPGMNAPPIATLKSLDVQVALWPLLWREVVVESFVLNDPVIELRVDQAGRRSWDFSRRSAMAPQAVRVAQAQTETLNDAQAAPEAADRRAPNLNALSLRDVRIENGTVRYADDRDGSSREVTGISSRLSLKSLNHPAEAEGTLTYRGEEVAFDLELGSVEPILANLPASVALKLSSRPLTAAYEGTLLFSGDEADGALTAKAPSIAAAATWLGGTMPRDAQLGTLDLSGQLRVSGKHYMLSHTTLNINGTAATGQISLDAKPARPVIRGDLEVAELDLNALLAPPQGAQQPQGNPAASGTPQEPSIEKLILRQSTPAGPQVKGYTSRGGWSEEPVNVAALAAADADVKISVGSLLYKDLKVGRSRMALTLDDRVLKANFEELALYGGSGQGFVTVDAKSPELPHVGLNITLDGVAIRPLLRDAAKLDWIEGQGRVKLAVAGSGSHQRAVMESLTGKAELNVAKGALIGMDINKMAEGVAGGKFKSLQPSPGDKTAFTGLTATWAIDQGIARSSDLRVSSDLVEVTGAGTVTLPDRSLDITVKPKLVSAQQEDGKGLSGIEVPVRVSGSWEQPKYKADVGGAVQELGRRFKGKNAGEIVDELVGKDENGESKAKKLFDKLFR